MSKLHNRPSSSKLKRMGYMDHMDYNALPEKDKKLDIAAMLKKKGPCYAYGWNQCPDNKKMPEK